MSKVQRTTTGLGFNTAASQDSKYAAIEAKSPLVRCADGLHEGERMLPVRQFYLSKDWVQPACITCQKRRRSDRSQRCRDRYAGLAADVIRAQYVENYGPAKTCSKCKVVKSSADFSISIGMECGLHNHCMLCARTSSAAKSDVRDYIFMPDKDNKPYEKKAACERCGEQNKLAIDHILPLAKGGTDCIDNKQTLCVHCNSKKSDTIDCDVSVEMLCERYRDDDLDFADRISLNQVLSAKVAEFIKKNIDEATPATVRENCRIYKVTYNLGHNLDRICNKLLAKP